MDPARLRDCYKILDLPDGASPEQVSQAYRDLAKVWHPDRFPHDSRLRGKAEKKMAEINVAYREIEAYHQAVAEALHTHREAQARHTAEANKWQARTRQDVATCSGRTHEHASPPHPKRRSDPEDGLDGDTIRHQASQTNARVKPDLARGKWSRDIGGWLILTAIVVTVYLLFTVPPALAESARSHRDPLFVWAEWLLQNAGFLVLVIVPLFWFAASIAGEVDYEMEKQHRREFWAELRNRRRHL